MKSLKSMPSFSSHLKEQLKNPEFKKEFDRLEPEFALIRLLIETRIKKGITQKELAKKMGTKQSAISRFEAGGSNPTLEFMQKLADGLGKTLNVTLS